MTRMASSSPMQEDSNIMRDIMEQQENNVEEIEDELYESDAGYEFGKQKRQLNYRPSDPDISTLHRKYKNGELILDPEFQRNFVWDNVKSSNLIESILLKIPIPIIFTFEDEEKEEVIDGQQRLTAIFSFIDGKYPDGKEFKLSKLKILSELAGKRFKDLDESLQKQIWNRGLPLIHIQESSQEDVKFEMFERLNTNITRLNAQELRNCMYRGPYNELIKKLAAKPDFQEILNKHIYSKRMLDSELVLLFFAFYHKNYQLYKGNAKQLLNEDMRKYRHIGSEETKELEAQFNKSVSLVKQIFGKNAFRICTLDDSTKQVRFDTRKLNQGLFLVLMYGFTPYRKEEIIPVADLIREEMINLQIHDASFLDSLVGSGTNSKEKVIKKIDIWMNTLKGIVGYPSNEPRSFSYDLKKQLFDANPICGLCGQKIVSVDDSEVDHIICYWKGGKTIPQNARLTHRTCNRMRGGDFKNESSEAQ